MGIVFACFAALALGYVPIKSRGVLRASVSCELSAPVELWWSSLHNPRHILSYGVLCVLAAACFSKHRLPKAAGVTLGISAIVELEQAFFAEGHCRIRDMLPNAIAVCLAVLLWLGTKQVRERR